MNEDERDVKKDGQKEEGMPSLTSDTSGGTGFNPPDKMNSLQQAIGLFGKTQELAMAGQREEKHEANLPGIYLRLRDRSMREGYRESMSSIRISRLKRAIVTLEHGS